jgi:predicted phosphodiesterase
MTTKISTDWHIGVTRSGGTTPASQVALRKYIIKTFADCLDDTDHLICGDLFNSFTVETSEVLETYKVLAAWLAKYGKKLAIVRGNHDYSVRGTQESSFDLLVSILQLQFPEQVTVARDVTIWKNFVLVPHLPNNDLLNMAIDSIEFVKDKFVVFHANLDNKFAEHSDHSLNVSLGQAKSLVDRGATVLFGHEHIARRLMNEKVIVLGNSAPSSVADCLGNDRKYAHRLSVAGAELERIKTWSSEGPSGYAEIDWRDLIPEDDAGCEGFIRVTGNATAEEAEQVVEAIAKYRAKSSAFVITNAVVVDGLAGMDALAEYSAEAIKSFDVFGALLEGMNDREQTVLRGLV